MDNKKKDKGLVSVIRSRVTSLKTSHTDYFDNADAFYQMYRSAMQFDDSYPWDYQLTDPLIFSLVRNIMSRLNPERMKIDLNPTSESSSQSRNANMKLLEWELREINKTLVFYRAMWGGLIKGRCYLETGWKYEPSLKMRVSDSDDSLESTDKVFRDITNRADIKNVRFEDVYVPNLNEPDIENQPYILQRISMTYGDMLRDNENKPTWKESCLKYIKKHKLFSNKVDYGDDFQDETSRNDETDDKDDDSINGQYLKMIKMQTKENKIYYILEDEQYDQILNEDTDNPYWHGHYSLLSWTPFPEDYRWFTMGIVQPLADLAIASSSVLNQYLTNNRKSANPMWIVGADGAQTPDYQFVNRPDGIIKLAGDVNQIKQVSSLDSSNTMLNMRNHLSQTFEKAASMSSLYSSGVGDSGGVNKTAGGARIISQNIDANMQLLLGLFASQLLNKIGEHFLELNAQYITEEQVIKVTGEEGKNFITVKPEEVSANFDVYVNPYTIEKVTPQVKQAALMNLKSVIDQEQQIKIDKGPIWKALFASYPEIEGLDNMILDPTVQAKDAIAALLKGVLPEIDDSLDFKTVRQKVQLFMIENQDQLDDETVMLFSEYVDKLTNWMKTQQQLFTAELPPQQPLPTNMEDLEMSMAQSGVADGPQQPFIIPQDQM